MVDFRYHLVSIIAVFLALAVGIVVGTTALNGPVLDGLKGSVSHLTADKRALEGNVRELRGTVADDSAFADLVAPALVRGRLAGERVLVISTSDADNAVRDGLLTSLADAGATVAGRLRLRPDLTDPARSRTVDAVVTGAAPAGLALPESGPAARVAAELASSLVRGPRTGSGQPVTDAQAQEVLSAFAGADLLDLESDTFEATATLVLVVTGPVTASPSTQQTARLPGLLALVDALDARSGVVVAGPVGSADTDGLLRSLRSGSRGERLSTVDDADLGQGRVAAVLALREQATGGQGRYGTGRGAQATAPAP